MHQTRPDGTHIASFCDFCRIQWDPELGPIMIEGHQGSLMCTKCLSIAYTALVLLKQGEECRGMRCTMCIEDRQQPEWQSPAEDQARACLRCIRQAATTLDKDKESGWSRPIGPGGVAAAANLGDDDEDE